MAGWTEGYVADVAYTSNFYREITPGWLNFACLLLGQRPPEAAGHLRYAELGCGFGFTAAVVAACHPEAEVWAFDFNPAHVEAARETGGRAGLANLRCEERSFADLAGADDLPQFDVVTLHGVYSWIAPAHRRQIAAFLDRRLRPGGLVYVSYNVATGWASMGPLQALMRLVSAASPARSDGAVLGAVRFIERLREGGAAYLPANPAVESRLKTMTTHDPRYVAHEYLNAHWHPMMSADVAAELAEAKCAFVGSATLSDNIDAASVPGGMLKLLAEQPNAAMRETVRDFACAQTFRRDVFRRGLAPLPSGEHLDRLDALTLHGSSARIPDEVTFACSVGQVTGKPEVYRPLLEALAAGPLTLAVARELPAFRGKPVADALQALTLLVSGGHAHPELPGATQARRDATRRLNREVARANRAGGALGHLASPVIGSGVAAELIETLVVGELLEGRPAESAVLTEAVAAALSRTGRHIQAEGKPVAEPAAARAAIRAAVDAVLAGRVPLLRRLGVLD